jgi:hypothetical protein
VHRFGADALQRLAKAGIRITDEEYAATTRQVERLRVPIAITARAPYWDPIVLDQLYIANVEKRIPLLPSSPFAHGFSSRLLEILEAIQRLVPYYYEKHFGEVNSGTLRSIASAAQKWSAEVPLREIITWSGNEADLSWQEVDRRINRVNQQVVFDVPKLLKPIAAMQSEDNPIVGFLEMGAFRPEVRRLIELGIPRETALRARARLKLDAGAALSDTELLAAARSVAGHLNYWEQRQILSVMPSVL